MQSRIKEILAKYYIEILLFVVCVGFYMVFYCVDGVIICADSHSYIERYLYREPLYPAYLAFFRMLFASSGTDYLSVAVFFQCLITGLSTWSFVSYLKKEFSLSLIPSAVIAMICLIVSIICRFLAQRGSMYSNCIMTESLCIPLFLLFSRYILEYCIHFFRKPLMISAILSVILISTRKQMLITLILLCLTMLYVAFRQKSGSALLRIGKGVIYAVITSLIILGLNSAIEFINSYCLYGQISSHFNDNRFLATEVFYVSEHEDADRIDDPDIRDLFLSIYEMCDAEGNMMHSANGGVLDRADFFADHYDAIQIDHMWVMIESFADQILSEDDGGADPIRREALVDQTSRQIITSILKHRLPSIIKVFGYNFIKGLCNTVAKSSKKLLPYVLIIMALYIVLMTVHITRAGADKLTVVSFYSLVSVLINVAVVSAVIFPQVRYTIYNMPLFYTSLFLLIHDRIRKEKS